MHRKGIAPIAPAEARERCPHTIAHVAVRPTRGPYRATALIGAAGAPPPAILPTEALLPDPALIAGM